MIKVNSTEVLSTKFIQNPSAYLLIRLTSHFTELNKLLLIVNSTEVLSTIRKEGRRLYLR